MALVLAVAGCGSSANSSSGALATPTPTPTPTPAKATATPKPKPKPKPKVYPSGPAMRIESIAPLSGTTVGVAMPISIVFADPVAVSARKQIEDRIALTTSVPITGAWHWFSARRVDFRPTVFWKSGTRVSMVASFDHVPNGFGEYGTQTYSTDFSIGSDVETHVYVDRHLTVVTEGGRVVRSMPSDAGSPVWPSWDGTMAVVEKLPTVKMNSCTVEISCDPHSANYYNLSLPWDVRLTWSGTFIHYSGGDPYPGHSYGSHGCVHLSFANAKWFYELSKPGDPVVVTGSPRGKADGDNGYADFDLTWQQWLAGSARGSITT